MSSKFASHKDTLYIPHYSVTMVTVAALAWVPWVPRNPWNFGEGFWNPWILNRLITKCNQTRGLKYKFLYKIGKIGSILHFFHLEVIFTPLILKQNTFGTHGFETLTQAQLLLECIHFTIISRISRSTSIYQNFLTLLN